MGKSVNNVITNGACAMFIMVAPPAKRTILWDKIVLAFGIATPAMVETDKIYNPAAQFTMSIMWLWTTTPPGVTTTQIHRPTCSLDLIVQPQADVFLILTLDCAHSAPRGISSMSRPPAQLVHSPTALNVLISTLAIPAYLTFTWPNTRDSQILMLHQQLVQQVYVNSVQLTVYAKTVLLQEETLARTVFPT